MGSTTRHIHSDKRIFCMIVCNLGDSESKFRGKTRAPPTVSVRERKVQAGGEQNIVLLGSRGWIGHVDTSERVCRSILACVIEVGEEVHLFSQQSTHPQFVTEFFAH